MSAPVIVGPVKGAAATFAALGFQPEDMHADRPETIALLVAAVVTLTNEVAALNHVLQRQTGGVASHAHYGTSRDLRFIAHARQMLEIRIRRNAHALGKGNA